MNGKTLVKMIALLSSAALILLLSVFFVLIYQ